MAGLIFDSSRLLQRLKRVSGRFSRPLPFAEVKTDRPSQFSVRSRTYRVRLDAADLPYGWLLLSGHLRRKSARQSLRISYQVSTATTESVPPHEAHRLLSVLCSPTGFFRFCIFIPPQATSLSLTLLRSEEGTGHLSSLAVSMLSRHEALLREGARLFLQRRPKPRRALKIAKNASMLLLQGGIGAVLSRYSEGALRSGGINASISYEAWIDLYASRDEGVRRRDMRAFEALSERPLLSIVVPVYNPKIELLARAIDSVRAQIYAHWQLVLVDDASPNLDVLPALMRFSDADARIEVVRRSKNGHISRATNDGIARARGTWVAFLDQDDELCEHALLRVAQALIRVPDAGLIYSDEDKVDEAGRRYAPFFKPDWDPVMLRAQNYINHLTVVRTDLVRKVGGLRVGFEGAQDHDLMLRLSEQLTPQQIVHIDEVLYHWRAIAGSTAHTRDAKAYVQDAAQKAVREHMQRIQISATVRMVPPGVVCVTPTLPEERPLVSLIIPTRDSVALLRMCVGSIFARTKYPKYQIIIVDNESTEPETLAYFEELRRDTRVVILPYPKPFNYSALNNFAVQQAEGSVIGLINNDIEIISPGWLDELVAHALEPGVGAVGAMLYYPHDTVQHAGIILGIGGVAGHAHKFLPRGDGGYFARAAVTQTYAAVTAACLLIRRDLYLTVGGLDESLAVAFNDVDFCLRVRAQGMRNRFVPSVEAWHHESATRGHDITPEQVKRAHREVAIMKKRWGSLLAKDPHYNRNLTLVTEDFALGAPARSLA